MSLLSLDKITGEMSCKTTLENKGGSKHSNSISSASVSCP